MTGGVFVTKTVGLELLHQELQGLSVSAGSMILAGPIGLLRTGTLWTGTVLSKLNAGQDSDL